MAIALVMDFNILCQSSSKDADWTAVIMHLMESDHAFNTPVYLATGIFVNTAEVSFHGLSHRYSLE